MYFIPHKNKWYSRIVHTRPIYRYGFLFLIAGLLFFGGRGLFAWLDMIIYQEQATLAQLQQQLNQQLLAQCQCTALHDQLPVLQQTISQKLKCCIGNNCCDQCTYIFEEVHKAGLQIIGYQTENESHKKEWKQKQCIKLTLNGSLDQLQTFLTALKKSLHMVQCSSLSLQLVEGAIFTIYCTIQFIFSVT